MTGKEGAPGAICDHPGPIRRYLLLAVAAVLALAVLAAGGFIAWNRTTVAPAGNAVDQATSELAGGPAAGTNVQADLRATLM